MSTPHNSEGSGHKTKKLTQTNKVKSGQLWHFAYLLANPIALFAPHRTARAPTTRDARVRASAVLKDTPVKSIIGPP